MGLHLLTSWVFLVCADRYDEGSARTHIKRLVDILERPPVITMVNQGPADEAAQPQPKTPRSRSQSQASQNNGQDGSEVPDMDPATAAAKAEEQKVAPEVLDQDEQMKRTYEEFNEVVRAHQADEVLTL